MKLTPIALLALLPCTASVTLAQHGYSHEERYAGCLFGDTVPLLRRGYSRDAALSIASRQCESLSAGISEQEIQALSDYVMFSIAAMEH